MPLCKKCTRFHEVDAECHVPFQPATFREKVDYWTYSHFYAALILEGLYHPLQVQLFKQGVALSREQFFYSPGQAVTTPMGVVDLLMAGLPIVGIQMHLTTHVRRQS